MSFAVFEDLYPNIQQTLCDELVIVAQETLLGMGCIANIHTHADMHTHTHTHHVDIFVCTYSYMCTPLMVMHHSVIRSNTVLPQRGWTVL